MITYVATQGAAERLQRGAELLSQKLEQDDRYYSAAAQLQRHWKLKVGRLSSFAAAFTHIAALQTTGGVCLGGSLSETQTAMRAA